MAVFLLGYRGCGKTTTGKRLASRLWQDFFDTDAMVVKAAGKSIAEVWAEKGEAYFRDLEAAAVREVLGLQEGVVALGGGAVVREESRAAIKGSGHKRIYLRCEPEVLAARLAADATSAMGRPSLTGQGASSVEEIRQVLAVREPIYREVMTAELDVTHLTPEEAAVYIVRLI